jgi:ABC-type transport system involved in cytochrome bd biosynthesis fused ATPase/permease subunit
LVLDEPTAALDAETERDLVRTLAEVMRGRTIVVITHRDSLIEIANQIVHVSGARCEVSERASA